MYNKNILIATNLNVWSIKKGMGAPSFYKTLELYNNKGFNVHFYTTEKNCDLSEFKNVKIFTLPKLKLFNIRYLYSIQRIFHYLLNQFFLLFFLLLNKDIKKIDLFYGYEVEFIPALHIIAKIFNKPYISRFQGTTLYPLMEQRFWKLRFFSHYFSIKLPSNVTIMTNDGTKGDVVIKSIRGNDENILFLKNGVDFSNIDMNKISNDVKLFVSEMSAFDYNFISVSRLQNWKRVDRSIDVFNLFHKSKIKSRFIIVGDGDIKKHLASYSKEIGINEHVLFTGGLNAHEVNYLLSKSDIFLSHYELSNLGNPLWEAMNNNCLVVTLNNGDTGEIIQNRFNGIISDESNYLNNAEKLLQSIEDDEIKTMIDNAQVTLNNNLTSWETRMNNEFKAVSALWR